MPVKVDQNVIDLVKEWQLWREKKNIAEKKDKELSDSLKSVIRGVISVRQINDPETVIQVGDLPVFLQLNTVNPRYGKEITPDMVGTRPLAQRGYEILTVINKEI